MCVLPAWILELCHTFLLVHCRVVPIAMDRAIKEIVPPIVQRSVTIATQTTKELVLKVFFFYDFIFGCTVDGAA